MNLRASLKHIELLKWSVILRRALARKYGIVATLGKFSAFVQNWRTYRELPKNNSFSLATSDLYPRLFDDTKRTPVDPVYFYQDVWFAKKIFETKPAHHTDIGSHLPTIGVISQFVPTTMVDIRPPEISLPGLSFTKGSILDLPFRNGEVSSLSSICVIEHIGLGRYGDPLDAFGSEKAAAELARVLAPGGNLYLSVPVDSESRVYFNAHRAFTRDYIMELFGSLRLVEERYIYGNQMVDAYVPVRGFGTGLYHFSKA